MLAKARRYLFLAVVNHLRCDNGLPLHDAYSLHLSRDRTVHEVFISILVTLVSGLAEFFLTLPTGEVPPTISKRNEGAG